MAKLAINGGKPVRTKPFPLWPIVGDEEKNAVSEVVASGRWAHLFADPGSRVEEFRERFARYFGVDYVILTTNGSVALEVALRNAGVGPGDEVITPPTTWVATNLAPVMVGADPVFVDVSPDNYGLDPDKLEEAITERTKAIIPVHIGGYPCHMKGIMEVADRHGLVVIEDCAQAHGSKYDGRFVGTIGHFGCFSFELTKLMSSGEGGAVIANDDSYGEHVIGMSGEAGQQFRRLFARGRQNVGWNSRMTEMQAAILIAQLGRLEAQRKTRAENADYLEPRLAAIEGLTSLSRAPQQNYYSYMLKYDSRCFKDAPKQTFMEAVAAEGITLFSSPSHQPPAYRSPKFYSPRRDYSDVNCPVAEKVFVEEAIGIRGTWVLLGNKADMDNVVDAFAKVKDNIDELIA